LTQEFDQAEIQAKVIFTSVIHVLVNIVISCLAFKEIGGYDGMVRRYMSEDAKRTAI
jgi:hypothetical protein